MKNKIVAMAVATAIASPSAVALAQDKDGKKLKDLICAAGQIAEYDGTAWVCADQPTGEPERELLDGNGNVLGDVLLVETACSVWANIELFGSPRKISVTIDTSKTFRQGCGTDRGDFASFSGSLAPLFGAFYDQANCTGNAYFDTRFRSPQPPLLDELKQEPVFVWENSGGTQWQEVELSTSGQGFYLVSSTRSRSDSTCVNISPRQQSLTPVIGFGAIENVPAVPLSVRIKQ
jgi:hypothetical protein